jgi:hypothetical protein
VPLDCQRFLKNASSKISRGSFTTGCRSVSIQIWFLPSKCVLFPSICQVLRNNPPLNCPAAVFPYPDTLWVVRQDANGGRVTISYCIRYHGSSQIVKSNQDTRKCHINTNIAECFRFPATEFGPHAWNIVS